MMRRGQSLLELLVAFFVIAIGLMSAVTLVFSNLALVDRDANEVVAVNLAREGIEFAKNIRDSNWLAGADFDAGLYNPTVDYTATPVWDAISGIVSLDVTANDFTHERTKIIKASNGLLINRPSSPPPSTDTVHQRLMTLGPICYNDETATYTIYPTFCVGRRVGIRVESRVRSTRKGTSKDVVMYEDLYDWR